MKAKTFKALLTGIILLIALMQSGHVLAADYYWRVAAETTNFNNPNNWTDSPSGIGGLSTGTYPTVLDNVFFTNESNIKNIIVPPSTVVNMGSITASGGYGYTLTTNTTYNIAGSISLDGTFTIPQGTINFVDNTAPVDVTVDLGTSNPIAFGNSININKPLSKINLINNDFKPTNASINIDQVAEFNSNGYDIDATIITTRRTVATAPRIIDLSGTTLTLTALSAVSNRNSEIAHDANSTFIFDGCDLICNNPLLELWGYADSEALLQFKSITLQHPTKTTIHTHNRTINLTVEDLIFKSPLIETTTRPVSLGWLKKISVTNDLIIPDTCFILIGDGNISNATTIEVNNIVTTGSVCGASHSVIQAGFPVTLESTGAPLVTQNLAYKGIIFSGSGWTAPATDNLGGNSGNITWNSATSRAFYWVENSGDWDDPSHWSIGVPGGNPASTNPGNCTPTIIDDVYIDINSFTISGQSINLTAPKGCRNIYWDDPNRRGSLTTIDNNISLSINGDADFSGVATAGIHPSLYFMGSGNHTITSVEADTTYRSSSIYFTGTGIYTLQNDFISTQNVNGTNASNRHGSFLAHYSGGLVSNGNTIDLGRFSSLSYPATSRRTLDLSKSEVKVRCNVSGSSPAIYNLRLDSFNLDSYDFSESHIYINSNWNSSSNEVNLLATNGRWDFNDITFQDPNAATTINISNISNQTSSIRHLTCDGRATFSNGFIVDSLILTPEKTYTFAANQTYTINKGLTTRSNGCNMAIITSNHATNMARLNATYSPFEIEGANITRINATGSPLTVNGGLEGGANTNVTVTPFSAKTLYWVGGTGNWSDPSNWSIGVSDGDPAVTNPGDCIPSNLDSVVFDGNSFSAIGQTVTFDMTPVNIRSMTWTSGVNDYQPIFTNNAITSRLNLSGSLEWASEMNLQLDNRMSIYFTGTDSHTYTTNDVVPSVSRSIYYYFTGAGSYDLIGNVYNCEQFIVNGAATKFYSNGYDINSIYITLTQGASGTIDLTGSTLNSAQPLNITVTNNATFFSDNTILIARYGVNPSIHALRITNTNQPVTFKSISCSGNMTSTDSVSVESITMTGAGNNHTINGKFVTDTLSLATTILSPVYYITAGTTLTVNDVILGAGTPCAFLSIKSTDATEGGQAAIIKTNNCNIDLPFFSLTNIVGENPYCPAQAFSVLGENLSDNSISTNILFTTPPSGTMYYDPTTIPCDAPLDIVPGNPISFKWYKDGDLDPSQTGRTYDISCIGHYRVEVEFPGIGCAASYEITITGIVDIVPPALPSLSDTTLISFRRQPALFSGTSRDLFDVDIDDCSDLSTIKRYSLSGATTATSVIANTLDGIEFNVGITEVTWYVTDSVTNTCWYTGARPAGNTGTTSFYVFVSEAPDNVSDADCWIEPAATTFTIRESATFDGVHSMSTPLVADLDGDGKPEIIAPRVFAENVIMYTDGFIIANVIDGTSRDLTLPIYFAIHGQSVAIADVDGDGIAEIFVQSADDSKIYCFTPTGAPKAGFTTTIATDEHYIISIADLNNDGNPELIAGPYIFNAKTGVLLLEMIFEPDGTGFGNPHSYRKAEVKPYAGYYFMPVIGDVDGDGKLEIAAGSTVYYPNIVDNSNSTAGNTYTHKRVNNETLPAATQTYLDGPTVLVDFDNDGLLDVCVLGYSETRPTMANTVVTVQFYAWNPRTQEIIGYADGTLSYRHFSIPSVGDLDGNGYVDFAFTSATSSTGGGIGMTSYQYDETQPTKVAQGLNKPEFAETAGFTLFDFNQDGKSEIVYRGSDLFNIVDGTTLADLSLSMEAFSGTIAEYPIVADIDNDGQAEIILTRAHQPWNGSSNLGGVVAVYKSANSAEPWAPARPVWNQWAYNSVYINDDMTVPKYPMSPAVMFPGSGGVFGDGNDVQPYNGFLQQQTILNTDGVPLWIAPDVIIDPVLSTITVTIDSTRINACIINIGDAGLIAPVYYTIYKNSVSAANKLKTDSVMAYIYPGDTVCVTTSVENTSIIDAVSLILVANDDGTTVYPVQPECNDSNNEILFLNPSIDMKKNATLLGVPHRGTYANPVSILHGEEIEYSITATNININSGGVMIITDTLPAYLNHVPHASDASGADDFDTDTDGGTPSRDILKWTFTTGLTPMATKTVTFKATPRPGVSASQPLFINHAWVTVSDTLELQTNGTFHQGAGISIMTFSAGLGGDIFNANEQALDYMSKPQSGVLIVPDEDYRFVGWSHGGYTSLRGVAIEAQEGIMLYDTLTVYGNVELFAVFKPIEDGVKEDVEPHAVETGNRVWAVENELFITTTKPGSILRIYTPDGVLREQHTIVASGTTSRIFPRGIYIVTINNDLGSKVRIE